MMSGARRAMPSKSSAATSSGVITFAPAEIATVSSGFVVFSTAKPGVSTSGGHSTETLCRAA
jgi:hypothetical protein